MGNNSGECAPCGESVLTWEAAQADTLLLLLLSQVHLAVPGAVCDAMDAEGHLHGLPVSLGLVQWLRGCASAYHSLMLISQQQPRHVRCAAGVCHLQYMVIHVLEAAWRCWSMVPKTGCYWGAHLG